MITNSNLGMSLVQLTMAIAWLTGCAGTKQIVPRPAEKITIPSEDKCWVVLYRLNEFEGSAVGWKVVANKKQIGRLGPGGYLFWECELGFVELEVRSDSMGSSVSGWKQFHAKPNELMVLETELHAWGGRISVLVAQGERRKKLLSAFNRQKK